MVSRQSADFGRAPDSLLRETLRDYHLAFQAVGSNKYAFRMFLTEKSRQ
ncbi:hypothetical protein V6767_06630 [Martelella sp. FLE1502]